ncbi:DUF2470 domain-containing protein [Actinomadura sp. DC4]|uniref:DUF2470 domain-containing protein n=1 Tax=Actinomadura sp. DC4 TaxID=3055069 RepID=UPI0025B1AECF|nr:DUF2470 domain-containing protein [Actinomadura sp. DC4]MDN3358778.1 DUF2470 domain-containing protein [Actinomadura sp. DC4]
MSAIESPEPTAAELVRSVLAAARSLTLTTEAHRVELVGLHSLEAPGRLLLNVPSETHLSSEVAASPYGDVTATIEFTDVAPVAVPDRIRARVVLGGWIALADGGPATQPDLTPLSFEAATVELEHGGQWVDVDPDEFAVAEPDPLAETEAEILTHLAGAHSDAIELLAQLVDARLLNGVTRVDPLRLDRYGVVLRLQRAGGTHDVRLAFPSPLRNPAHGVVELRTLLARARACPRRRTRM